MGRATVETMGNTIKVSNTTVATVAKVAKVAILVSSSNIMAEIISNNSRTLRLKQLSKGFSHASYASWKVAASSCKA